MYRICERVGISTPVSSLCALFAAAISGHTTKTNRMSQSISIAVSQQFIAILSWPSRTCGTYASGCGSPRGCITNKTGWYGISRRRYAGAIDPTTGEKNRTLDGRVECPAMTNRAEYWFCTAPHPKFASQIWTSPQGGGDGYVLIHTLLSTGASGWFGGYSDGGPARFMRA